MVQAPCAVCLNGMVRAVFSAAVHQTFTAQVRDLTDVDVFLAIVTGASGLQPTDWLVAHEQYRPKNVSILSVAAVSAAISAHCQQPAGRPMNPVWLKQFVSIRECWRMILHEESMRGSNYEWLFRSRTDIVYFSPISLMQHSSRHVYVPLGGMSGEPYYHFCSNDHMFLCPRHLCETYFNMLDGLFLNPRCTNATLSKAPDQFVLPTIPRVAQEQWYISYIYSEHNTPTSNGSTCPLVKGSDSCCGLVHEVPWRYAIAKSTGIQCSRVWYDWRPSAQRYVSKKDNVTAACMALHDMLYPNASVDVFSKWAEDDGAQGGYDAACLRNRC
mmetsp:Transcript_58325/g.160083  ORF Transcript_58325/g.160083 Transcript_58325/m.160083 type:complete len:328 (-) Transcript_58325:595-1578(-)